MFDRTMFSRPSTTFTVNPCSFARRPLLLAPLFIGPAPPVSSWTKEHADGQKQNKLTESPARWAAEFCTFDAASISITFHLFSTGKPALGELRSAGSMPRGQTPPYYKPKTGAPAKSSGLLLLVVRCERWLPFRKRRYREFLCALH